MSERVDFNPSEETEFSQKLREVGVLPPKPPSPTQEIQEAYIEAQQRAEQNRAKYETLDELDEREDEEDEAILESWRLLRKFDSQQRMAEYRTLQQSSVYNQVYPIQKPDYSRDVTEASNKAFVLVNLTSSLGTNTESRLLTELWREAARKFGDIKFCEMRADLCIEGYPERNTPTILIYHKGDIVRQIVTLRELGGVNTKLPDLQKLLVDVGAIEKNDTRVLEDEKKTIFTRQARQNAKKDDEDDDDDFFD